MPLEIATIPCLSDNYAYLVNGPGGVAIIDAPEAGPIIDALEARGWAPSELLLTHHHHDHVGGVEALKARYGCKVMGPEAEQDKLPPIDMALPEGMTRGTGAGETQVIAVPGHTLGHVAYHYPKGGAVFTADSLMACGCGRVFEGTPDMMWQSLSRLMALPPDTMVYSGHEYTSGNVKFALTIDPENPDLISRARQVDADTAAGRPTAQVLLSLELATNPFLRAADPAIRDRLGMTGATDAEVFAEIRARKDRF